jgi:phenylacetic acid degradation operon negative regulatory protein
MRARYSVLVTATGGTRVQVAEALQPAVATASGPRSRVSVGSARSLLLTVLGEFVMPSGQAVWTSTLLHALLGVGTAENAARQAIARSAAAGWLEGRKDGRQVRWRLTTNGRRMIESGSRRVTALSAPRPAWDGRWRVLVITVPNSQRDSRRKLYRGLSWAGFGNPTPGTWVTPNAEAVTPAAEVVEDLGLSSWCLSFEGSGLGIGLTDQDIVDQAWDLDAIAQHYAESLSRFADVPVTGGDEALFTQIALVNELQRFPFMDPRLPFELLPANWPGRTAPARFQEIRAEWHDAAHERWHELTS